MASQIQGLAGSFRQWLGQLGISSPFEMQFSLAQNGDPIVNVVGSESEKIVDCTLRQRHMAREILGISGTG